MASRLTFVDFTSSVSCTVRPSFLEYFWITAMISSLDTASSNENAPEVAGADVASFRLGGIGNAPPDRQKPTGGKPDGAQPHMAIHSRRVSPPLSHSLPARRHYSQELIATGQEPGLFPHFLS